MKISTGILSVILTALLGLEAWTLQQVVDLKVQVGQLSVKLETLKRASNPITNKWPMATFDTPYGARKQ